MKINFKKISSLRLLSLCLLISQLSFSQKKNENIGTEVVDVVKAYTPTISDAFKVKEIPELNDEGNDSKETVKYNFFSFPVASTFTPAKGKAQGVEKEKQARLYDNYATFGVGNYGTVNAELFVFQELNSSDYVGGMLRHLSSQGGIKDVELKDSFYDTSIDLTYGVRERDMSWNVDLGYQNQIYNWYGLPTDFGSTLLPTDREDLVNGINPQQSYNNIYMGGKLFFSDDVIKDVSVKFNNFSDDYGSAENRFLVKSSFQADVTDFIIDADVVVDYLGTSFKNDYWKTNTEELKYGYTNFGVIPSFKILEDDWTIDVGVGLFYSLDLEGDESKFFVYPEVNASYKVVGDLMIFYAGAGGDLKQNTYADFVSLNPYLSPSLVIAPTNKQLDAFAGLKGKLTNTISYDIRASYFDEKNKALFKSNDYTEDVTNESYAFGNSFGVVYDDMKTLQFYGALAADISEDLTFTIDGIFNSFTNDYQIEAWNLPEIKLNAKADFNITEEWYAGVNLFFVGDRKDMQMDLNNSILEPVTLKSYFDLNAHVGYKYTEKLTAFLRLNNITNQGYERWLNYPVQGFQAVIGANYKFDF